MLDIVEKTVMYSNTLFALQEGVFALWKVDARGRAQYDPIVRHKLGPAVTTCIAKPGDGSSPDLRYTTMV